MRLLDLTLSTPEENLALEEALLEEIERGAETPEVLRLWESPSPIVVIGRASQVEQEVNLAACRRDGVPVLRRTSGGAAIVAGPGCLMYAVLLSISQRPELAQIDEAHRLVLGKTLTALKSCAPTIEAAGTSDLAIAGNKVSGNSLRMKRSSLLYHGTLLYDFSLDLVPRYLNTPPRMPDYRQQRSHGQFVTNLSTDGATLRQALIAAWGATDSLEELPTAQTAALVQERYSDPKWNLRR